RVAGDARGSPRRPAGLALSRHAGRRPRRPRRALKPVSASPAGDLSPVHRCASVACRLGSHGSSNHKEACMSANPGWLALTAVLLMLGCKESNTGTSGASGTSSTTTSSGPSGTTSSTTGAATGVSATAQTPASSGGGEVTMPNGLKYQDLTVGTGAE